MLVVEGMTMMKRWSSSEIPPSASLAYWVDAVCSTLVRLRCEPRRDQKFFGEVRYHEIGPVKLVTTHSIAQRVTRLPNHVADDPSDFFHVNVMAAGSGLMIQGRREAEIGPGGMVLSDMTRPYTIDFAGDFAAVVLRVPRPMLLQRIGKADPFTILRVDGKSGLAGMVTSVLRDLPDCLATISASGRLRLAENLVDLVSAALLSVQEDGPQPARLTLTRAKFWIETHLGDMLSGEELARQCGVSVRHLNRLFAAEGSSLMHYVWERRLQRCHRELGDPALLHRSISDIAFTAGFNDLSHFSRSYRARFGTPPREARPKRRLRPASP
jgi:AraC-like DNA-binding protein